jgi:hypothetical protein
MSIIICNDLQGANKERKKERKTCCAQRSSVIMSKFKHTIQAAILRMHIKKYVWKSNKCNNYSFSSPSPWISLPWRQDLTVVPKRRYGITTIRFVNIPEECRSPYWISHVRGYIQKFPDWGDSEINLCENCPRPPSYVQLGTPTH